MEEFTIEVNDEIAAWLDSVAAAERKSPSVLIEEMLREEFERNRKRSGRKPPSDPRL